MSFFQQILTLFSQKDKVPLTLIFFGSILLAFFEIIGVASIAPFMSVVLDSEIIFRNNTLNQVYSYFEYSSTNQFLVHLGVLVVIFLAFANISSALVYFYITYFSKFIGHKISMKLLSKYLNYQYEDFIGLNSSEVSKNILAEVDRVVKGVLLSGLQAASKLILMTAVLIFLFIYNPVIAVVLIFALGGSYVLIYFLAQKFLQSIGIKSTAVNFLKYKTINEAMSGMKDIKLRNLENAFIKRFQEPSKNSALYTAQGLVIAMLPRYFLELIAFGGVIFAVIYLISIDYPTDTIIPILSVYALAGYRLLPAMQNIYSAVSMIRYNQKALEIISLELSAIPAFKNQLSSEPPQQENMQFQNYISLEDISYFYPETHVPILENMNLKISANTTVGFIGKTGSGKTTLVDVIMGLLPLTKGQLLVDDVRIDSKNLRPWQRMFGYVPQSIYLIDEDIRSNIGFGIEADLIDDQKIMAAVKMANLNDLIDSLEDGVHTKIGEDGIKLSGGQRQRIGIARALYHQPQILVFDEATSALDTLTEVEVMNAINSLATKITIIIIAHRVKTLKNCDMIFMLKNGKIEDSGSYDALSATNELFKDLTLD
jgi:ATP-binding cassette, subfamily B, bacterial PglK